MLYLNKGIEKPMKKTNLRWFFVIAAIYTLGLLIWIILTPSLSTDKYFVGTYSLPRFLMIAAMGFLVLLWLAGFSFSKNQRLNAFFEKLFASKAIKVALWILSIGLFFLILGTFEETFGTLNILLNRVLPLQMLAVLFFVEILVFRAFHLGFKPALPKFNVQLDVKNKEQRIAFLALIICAGFFAAVCFHYVQSQHKGLVYPQNTFLFRPEDRFNDFFNPLKGSFDRDPYNPERIDFIGGYLPFGYCVSFIFSMIRPWTLSCGMLVAFFLIFLWCFMRRVLYDKNKLRYTEIISLFILTALTYPVLFIVDRTNFDIVVFVFIALFVWFYLKGEKTLATLLLAVPIAMKGYPLVLLTIPLLEKRFKDIAITGGLVVLLEAFSLAIFKDGLIVEFSKMMTSFGTAFSIAFDSGALIRFNSSLYTFLLFLWPSLSDTAWFSKAYFITAILLFGGLAWTMFKQKYPFWKNLFIIIIIMILFPQSSGDYRLVMLIPPVVLFLSAEERSKWDALVILLAGFVLIPKAYYVFYSDINLGIVLNPLLLITLLISLLAIRFQKHDQLVKA